VGAFQELLGGSEGAGTKVEFHEQTMYRVHLNRRTIVVEERETEIVRRQVHGRWKRLGPPNVHKHRIILERRTGKVLQSPSLGVVRSAVKARGEGNVERRRSVLALR
jgi:hypothetical protein